MFPVLKTGFGAFSDLSIMVMLRVSIRKSKAQMVMEKLTEIPVLHIRKGTLKSSVRTFLSESKG